MIWIARGFKLEFSRSLKRLHALSGYDGGSESVSIRRFPVDFGLGIGFPDRDYDHVSLAIIDNGFWWRAHPQGPRSQGLESVDLAKVNLLSLSGFRDGNGSHTHQDQTRHDATHLKIHAA
jgi:hypothetical protein